MTTDNDLYEQVSNQLYVNRSCEINVWKNVVMKNSEKEIKVQAMMNTKNFIHIRKIDKMKDKIRIMSFHFTKAKELAYDGFGDIHKGNPLYKEFG